MPEEIVCPHCGTDVAAAAFMHAEETRRGEAVLADVERLLQRVGQSELVATEE